MNFKKTWKRFFSLSRRSDGFTLVELIVVIAILAILGGVAVPAYSGYVEKANKQADMTLVRDVANALQLYYYANPNAGPLAVVLNQEGTPAAATGKSIEAMEAVFGSGWENAVGLKFESWGETSASNMKAVNDSNYMQTGSTTQKLQDLQNLTASAVGLLGNYGDEKKFENLEKYLGKDFTDFCINNGLALTEDRKSFANATDNQLSNLMVLYVADNMSGMKPEDYESVLGQTMVQAQDPNFGYDDVVLPEGTNTTTYLAAQYAMFNSIAAATGDEGAARLQAVNDGLENANNMGQVQEALSKFFNYNDETDANFLASVNYDYYADDFSADSQAISAIMGAASAQAGSCYDSATDLDSDSFFTSDRVSAAVDSYMTAAQQLSSLNVGASAIVLYTSGTTPDVIVTPSDAYLVD